MIVTLPSVSSLSNLVSVTPSVTRPPIVIVADVAPARSGASAIGLIVTLMVVAAEVAMLPPSLVVPTTLSVKFPWSLSGTVICRPLRSVAGLSVQVLPTPALP